MERSDRWVLSLISLAVLAVLGVTGWMFLVDRNYDFVVEAACDPAVETCFYRECSDLSNLGDCPPNGLENYKIYVLNAADFYSCEDNSCANECRSGEISCEEVVCGEHEEDECAVYEPPIEEVEESTEDTEGEEDLIEIQVL